MRFRKVLDTQSRLVILLWTALGADNLHRDLVRQRSGHASFEIVMLVIMGLCLLLVLYAYFFSRLELEPGDLRLRIGFRSIRIPYDNIVAVRPVLTSKGKQLPKQLELETARLSRNIYPHDYRRLAVSDPTALFRAIHDKAPHVEYEPA